MNLFAIAGLSVCISCVILSVLTLIFSKTRLHRQLILFNLAVSVWGAGLFFVGVADTESEAIFGWKFANTGGFFVAPLFYHLVCILTGVQRRKLLYFAYFQAVFFAILSFGTKYLLYKTRFIFGLYFNEMNAGYFAAFVFYVLFIILSFYELLIFLKNTKGFKRTQTLYIIFGFMIGFIGATSSFLPMFRIDIMYPFGNFGITLYVIILTYAILRHRLMDLHLAFRKSLVYSISAGILTSVFITLVLTVTELLSDLVGISSFPVIVASALIIAFLFTPLRDKVQMVIDKVFYRSTYDYYQTIQQVSRELASTIDLKHIYRLIVDTVFTTLKLKSAYLFSAENKHFKPVYACLFDKDRPLEESTIYARKISSESHIVKLLGESYEIHFKEELPGKVGQEKAELITGELMPFSGEAIAPIFIDNKLTFLMIFGDKISGDIFSDEDIKLIRTITNQAGIALKNAGLYEDVERQVIRLKQAEEEIKKQNEFLNNVLNSLTHPFYVINADNYTVTMANPATHFGVLSGKATCYALTHQRKEPCDDTTGHPCVIKRIKETGKPVIVEHIHYNNEGSPLIMEVHGYPIFDNKGNIAQVIEYNFDITDRKRAEEELRRHREHLQELVTERTAELTKTNERLQQEIIEHKRAEERKAELLKEVESVNQELKDFAYIVSHDLKAPLRAIGTLANWISTDHKDRLNEEGQRQLDLMVKRVKRMHALINGILEYSRVGRIKEKKMKVDLNDLVKEVLDMIAPPDNITVTVENELPVIVCEKTRIMEVFQNLLSNAVKFMDKPLGIIKIGSAVDDGYWKFSVSDNGPGIEEEYFDKIFQMFQTLSPVDEYESTGVGLTLVKKIITMYGGKVWVESEVGHGSTFFFTLPLNIDASEPDKQNIED